MHFVSKVLPGITAAYCCVLSMATIGMYLDHRRYFPVYNLADVLHLHAISAGWFIAKDDSNVFYALISSFLSIVCFLASLSTILNTEPAAQMYMGRTTPFIGITQYTDAETVDVDVYNSRLAALYMMAIASAYQLVFCILFYMRENVLEEYMKMQPSILQVMQILVFVLIGFCCYVNYPRFARVDSPHTTLLFGLQLANKKSTAGTFVLLVGLVFSILYTIGYYNDCEEGDCLQTTYNLDRVTIRTPLERAHVYSETSYLCLVVWVCTIAVASLVYVHNLFSYREQWIHYLKKSKTICKQFWS